MFSNKALEMLRDPVILQKIKAAMVYHINGKKATPSVRSLVNMAEFMAVNPCICPLLWVVSVTDEDLCRLDFTMGINVYITLIFHKDGLIEYTIRMPDDIMADVFLKTGKANFPSVNLMLDQSGIYEFIESGNPKSGR